MSGYVRTITHIIQKIHKHITGRSATAYLGLSETTVSPKSIGLSSSSLSRLPSIASKSTFSNKPTWILLVAYPILSPLQILTISAKFNPLFISSLSYTSRGKSTQDRPPKCRFASRAPHRGSGSTPNRRKRCQPLEPALATAEKTLGYLIYLIYWIYLNN